MRKLMVALGLVATMLGGAAPAQVRTIDPNQTIDGDLQGTRVAPPPRTPQPRAMTPPPRATAPTYREPTYTDDSAPDATRPPAPTAPAQQSERTPAQEQRAEATTQAATTFKRDDLIGAGEGVFGKGAEGFASIIEKILSEQGEPNAYIAGREAAGAFVVGLRYGSGIMTHKVEGQMPVYWTGPSVGFDVGGDANKVFVLVYNLYDTAELFRRFPAAEGRLYFIGGFAATYLRRGNVVLIPVRLGVGYRAGVNVGYMKFTPKSTWLPF
ncbi:EipA family protein [Sphingomonas sp. TZW2008]|uniref:EipA family protein n=1 Tax=Sphingomonas sp. TZW2008 TaxID=1917973 RepID=UPI000A26D2F6|nr:EipA family protein [Sphingomonas sp. TZW2008]